MLYVRIGIAIGIAAGVLPVLLLAGAYAAAWFGGCDIDLETATDCRVAGWAIGGLVDGLLGVGVCSIVTWPLAMALFAGWVMLELAVIIARGRERE